MNVIKLNKQFTRELIELYRSLPAVWKVKCVEYKSKVAKREAYNLLVAKCREYVPDADREFVRNKINSLRSAFRKERRKVVKSKENPDSEIHVPNLWYYNLLVFTADQDGQDTSILEEDLELSNQDSNDINCEPTCVVEEVISTTNKFEVVPAKKISRIEPTTTSSMPVDTMTVKTLKIPATNEDVFDAIGRNVAHKLRGMAQKQRIIAEKLVSDIMYHGQMETLTSGTHLVFMKDNVQ